MNEYEEGHNIPDHVMDEAEDDAAADRLIGLLLDFPDNGAGS